MAQKVLGMAACLVCGYADQEIREDKNGKPYMVCDDCGCQIFARQARSVKLLRALADKNPNPEGQQPGREPDKMSAQPAQAAPVVSGGVGVEGAGVSLLDLIWHGKDAVKAKVAA